MPAHNIAYNALGFKRLNQALSASWTSATW